MARICLVATACLIFLAQTFVGGPAYSDEGLIPVRPSYQEASYPARTPQMVQGFPEGRAPTPREQMYVFWILGKVLSYPIDQIESFIRKQRNKTAVTPIKASASSSYNPFKEIEGREIPPAPPVIKGPASATQ